MNIRQQKLLKKLKKQGSLSIESEAFELQVSSMTIRRDIQLFVDHGLAVKTHGGAVSRANDLEQLFIQSKASDAQRRIAVKAVELIPDKSSIMLSNGSTTLEVARQLAVSGKQLSVVTNSLPIAATLFQTGIQVILTGGTLRSNSLDLAGPVTEKNINEYYIDILISGCDGAKSNEGFFTKDLELAETERKSVEKSRKVIIVTESYKFNSPSFVKFASPDKIGALISDSGLSLQDQTKLKKYGIQVITC
ncbi:MAG: DeoR/GlpR family DNA-binding transcription regulator [Victivallaceae bacterium]|nr:DeoR/GlpR family DNA-binding transcription regulator [Victivallaceae bacterium]